MVELVFALYLVHTLFSLLRRKSMSIVPAGGWGNKPLEGEVVRPSTEPKQTVIIVRKEKESAFRNAFSGCLGAIGAVFVVIAALGLIGRLATSSEDQQTSKTAEALHVTAVELNAAYEANEVSADALYKGKTLYVTGSVKSINKDAWNAAYLDLADGDIYQSGSLLGVQAELKNDSETLNKTSALTRGSLVTVVCTEVHRIVGSVMLEGCKLGEDDDTSQTDEPAMPRSALQTNPANQQEDYTAEATKIYWSMDKATRDHPADGEGSNLLPPRLVHNSALTYPVDALPTGISGIVTVVATVGTDGKLSNIHVVKSVSPALDAAALQAFSTNQFEPARNSITNAPVASDVTQNLSFTPPQPAQSSLRPSTEAPAPIIRSRP